MASYVTTNGPMAYRDYGEGAGTPLVLLHAFPLDSRMWMAQADALAAERRVILPDYPGFGRSPQTPAQPDVHYYAESVRGLLERLDLERVILGGISMGGYVAFECLRLFPEKISGLVLANTRPDPDPKEARDSRRDMARRVSKKGVEVLVELQMERLLSRNTLENNEEVVSFVETMIRDSSPDGVVAALGALRERPDSTPLLPDIEVPALVIGGADDDISSPEVMGDMADKIPDSRHVVLEDAGHLSNLEVPREFDAALGEFLGSI